MKGEVNEGQGSVKGNGGDHTSEICHFFGGDGGKKGVFFLLGDNHWRAGWRRGNNLLKGLAANEGQVLLHGELWRGGHREI